MNQILVWQLSEDFKLVFSSASTDLSTITCCDRLTLTLQSFGKSTVLASDLSGCDVTKLQKNLKSLVDDQTLQSWISQLELLHILMEENELEKKSRGKSCC